MKPFLILISLVIFFCCSNNAYSLTTISETIKPEVYAEGVSETYLNEKIKEIVLNHINSQKWNAQTKDKYISNYSQIIAGYTLKKLDDTEGTFLLKINLNLDSLAQGNKPDDISIIMRDTGSFISVKMINAVLEDILNKPIYPSYISLDETKWDLKSSVGAKELSEKIGIYLKSFNVITDNGKIIIRRDRL